ncbi:MAG: hypothetical protein NVSMB43_14760 [Pseudarthrobacter sp.]
MRVEFLKERLSIGEDSPMANLMVLVMCGFAEFERSLIRERQREGIALAQQRGVHKGRKNTLTPERATYRGTGQPRRSTPPMFWTRRGTGRSFGGERTPAKGIAVFISGRGSVR